MRALLLALLLLLPLPARAEPLTAAIRVSSRGNSPCMLLLIFSMDAVHSARWSARSRARHTQTIR